MPDVTIKLPTWDVRMVFNSPIDEAVFFAGEDEVNRERLAAALTEEVNKGRDAVLDEVGDMLHQEAVACFMPQSKFEKLLARLTALRGQKVTYTT